jgi:hypothetical protein
MKSYSEYVLLGKAIVDQVQDRQMKICSYAINICTIRHGGRSDKFYTMKDYATDIGLNNKTLNQWMLVYRNVVVKLTPKQLETMTWRQASKANEYLEESNTIQNRIDGKPRQKAVSKGYLSPAIVQRVFDDAVSEKPFVGEFLNLVKQAKHCKHLLLKRDLSLIEDSHMLHLMEILDNCSDLINEHLTEKKKANKIKLA